MNQRSRVACVVAAFLLAIACAGTACAGSPVYPLKASACHRYLVDQNNEPYLVHGDTPWAIFYATTDDEAEEFLEDRRQKGFNTMQVVLLPHPKVRSSSWNHAGSPVWPFLTPNDISTPNEKYFARVDRVLKMGASKGMQFCINPIWFGPKKTIQGYGVEKLKKFGKFVGNRYKDFDNIIWLHGGDFAAADRSMDAYLDAVVDGINASDRRHLQTVHIDDPRGEHSDLFRTRPWYSVSILYHQKLIQDVALPTYNRQPTLPFFLSESCYEGEHMDWNPPGTAWRARVQAYCAVLCGASGQIVGATPALYWFDPGWQKLLDTPMYQRIGHLKSLFDARPWHLMVPDGNPKHEVVVAGVGEGWDYVPAARASDGSFILAYLPHPKTISIDMSKIGGGEAVAWWFNPRNGNATTSVAYPTKGTRQFTPPSAGKDDDWVLVIDDAAKGFAKPRAGADRESDCIHVDAGMDQP